MGTAGRRRGALRWAQKLALLCLLAGLALGPRLAGDTYAAPLRAEEPLVRVETLGGNINALEARDGLLYAAEGLGLSIFDVSTPTQPRRLGRVELPGVTSDLRLQGARAYVAMRDAGLAIVDVSYPDMPVLIATHVSPDQTKVVSVDVSGKLAVISYVGTRSGGSPGQRPVYWGGLQTLDISDPARPKVLGRVDGDSVGVQIRLAGSKAYVAAGQWGLEVFDLADPTQPRKLSGDTRYSQAGSLSIAGTRLYLIGNYAGAGQLYILDIAGQPALLAAYSDPQWSRSTYHSAAVSGEHVSVISSDGLFIVDAHSPTSPTTMGRVATPQVYYATHLSMAASAGFAFIELRSTGLGVVDVRRPATAALAITYATPASPIRLELRGTLAYTAEGDYGVKVIDLAGPQRPSVLGSYALDDPMTQSINDMVAGDTIIYLHTYPNVLQVLDVADPAHPRLLASYSTVKDVHDLELAGTRLYVGGATQLEIVDVANPARPARIATYRHGGTGVDSLLGLEVAGTTAYLRQAFRQIDIVDVANPAAPQPLSRIEGDEIAVFGELAYVSMGSDLRIYSVANRTAPQQLSSLRLPGGPNKLTVAGSLLYGMMSSVSGPALVLVDIADSARPRLLGSHDLDVEGSPIVVSGEDLYFTGVGLHHLKLNIAGLGSLAYADERCFPETRQCLGGPLRAYWEQHGGLPVFGFPLGPARHELNRDLNTVFATQWLERNRLELHPENRAPYHVLLGRLGDERLRQLGRDWQQEPRAPGPAEGCLWFEATRHNVCDQGLGLGFKSYWQSHGLEFDGQAGTSYAESLALFGLPLSEPRLETNSSGDTVLTQWFERARFEWHPDKPNPFKVLLGRLGDEVRYGASS